MPIAAPRLCAGAARLFQLRLLLSNIAQAMSWLNWVALALPVFQDVTCEVPPNNTGRASAAHRRRTTTFLARWSVVLLLIGTLCSGGCAALRRRSGEDPVLTSRQMSLRGMDALHQGRWDDAESLFKSAIALHPADERSHRQYAEVLMAAGGT